MIRRVALLVLAALTAAALAPASAAAHATIVETTPGDTAVLRVQPRVVSLKWSEPVDLGAHAIRLLDGAGNQIATPAAPRPGPGGKSTAVLALPRGLARGTYVVAWRVVSADSHPVSGAFSFSVGAPSAVLFSAAGGGSSATVRVLDGVGRALAYLGFALAVGGAVVLFGLWPGGRESLAGRRLLWGGLGALVLGSLVVLLMQGPYASGGSVGGAFSSSSLSFTLGTRLGQALVLRILFAILFLFLLLRRFPIGFSIACAVALVLTWTLTDHSQTGVQTWLGVPVASLHLLSMAVWFGGLLMLLVGVERGALAVVAPRFSRVAPWCFGVLAASGVYLAYRQSGVLGALPGTVFGRLILIKITIALTILLLAWFSRRAVLAGLSPLRSVTGEALLGVGVLGVTAALVNTTPARVAYVDPIDRTVAGPGGGKVEVKVNPAKQGENVADVYLVRRNGELLQVPELTARLAPRDGSSGPLVVRFVSAEPGHYVASRMTVPYPGDWTLRLQIRTSAIDESDIDLPLTIR
jgi:copper transport protein